MSIPDHAYSPNFQQMAKFFILSDTFFLSVLYKNLLNTVIALPHLNNLHAAYISTIIPSALHIIQCQMLMCGKEALTKQDKTRTASPATIPYSRGKIAEQATAVKGKMNGAYCAAL